MNHARAKKEGFRVRGSLYVTSCALPRYSTKPRYSTTSGEKSPRDPLFFQCNRYSTKPRYSKARARGWGRGRGRGRPDPGSTRDLFWGYDVDPDYFPGYLFTNNNNGPFFIYTIIIIFTFFTIFTDSWDPFCLFVCLFVCLFL